jgi:hypothetical protein
MNMAESESPEAQEARRAAEAAASKEAAEPKVNFVRMVKLGHKPLNVHPSAVASHKAAGWNEV